MGGREGVGGYAKGRSGGEASFFKLLSSNSIYHGMTSWQVWLKLFKSGGPSPPSSSSGNSSQSSLPFIVLLFDVPQSKKGCHLNRSLRSRCNKVMTENGAKISERCLGLSGLSSGRRFPRPGTSMTPSGKILSSLPRFCSEITEKNWVNLTDCYLTTSGRDKIFGGEK